MNEPLLGHVWLGTVLLAGVALQRLLELAWAESNVRRLVARGGILVPRDGTLGLIVVHVAWLAAMAGERLLVGARMPAALVLPLAAVLALVEVLRFWTLGTLGRRWTIRVVVVPGEVPVATGPYRLLRHPNYLVVTLEMLLIPVWLGAWWTAAGVVVPHALTLAARIRREEAAWRRLAGRALGSGPPAHS